MMPMPSVIEFKEAPLWTGVRLRYADVGPREAKPLMLLHGYSDSWFSFSGVVGLLPGLRLIIPDQRGHGDSERPAEGYELDDLASDAIALLDELGVASAAVLGHSLGSFVAQRMAILAAERITHLVLAASAATSRNDNVLSLGPMVESLNDPVDSAFVRQFQMSTIYRPIPDAFLDRAIAESRKLPAHVWKAVLAGMLENWSVAELGEIRQPVSIFWGDRDSIFGRAEQDELMRCIPGSRLHVFTEVGHALHWEAPAEFTQRLLAELR